MKLGVKIQSSLADFLDTLAVALSNLIIKYFIVYPCLSHGVALYFQLSVTHLSQEDTVGFVGADLASLCREAVYSALRRAQHLQKITVTIQTMATTVKVRGRLSKVKDCRGTIKMI